MAKIKDEIVAERTDEETTQEATHETTPETTEETEDTEVKLSSKEHRDLISQAKAAKELGRTLKTTLGAHTTLKTQYDSQSRRLSDLENTIRSLKQREREQELKAAEGAPDLVDSVRLKHQAEDEWEKVNKARSELENEKTQHQAAIDKAVKAEATELANELAKSSGMTATLLLQIGTDTAENGRTTYNLERMKQIAKSVPKDESEEKDDEENGKMSTDYSLNHSKNPCNSHRKKQESFSSQPRKNCSTRLSTAPIPSADSKKYSILNH